MDTWDEINTIIDMLSAQERRAYLRDLALHGKAFIKHSEEGYHHIPVATLTESGDAN